MQPCPQSPNQLGLCIDSMTTTISDEQHIAVSVRIKNLANNGAVGKVWWVLEATGSKAPWDSSMFTSSVDQRGYPAATKVDLSWNATVAPPNALYDLVLIVHVVDPSGSERHVDLRQAGPFVFRVRRPSLG